MALSLYDTMAREKRPFVPRDPSRVTMYVCGPTVYNYAHIGNARPVVVFDVLYRLLRHIYGQDAVIYAANVTDVDDKINRKAAEEGVAIDVVTDRYLAIYNDDMATLGALRPTHQPRATQTMDAIIEMIGTLVANKAAYAAEGHVLFDTQAYGDYGKLSRQPMEDMIAGARVDVAPYKQHPADFVLWKPSKENEPVWDSPWGPGRPGWHIECSAMIEKTLGLPIDIHGGGIDLLFPHHENEMAQGVCAGHDHGQGYANYWMHNGFLNINNEKMSKSANNFFTVREIADKYGYEPIRYFMLTAGYRMPLNYTVELIESCKNSLERMYTCRDNLDFAIEHAHGTDTALVEKCEDARKKFKAAMDDDLNTPDALAAIFDLVKDINTLSDASDKATLETAAKTFDELTGVLGLLYNRKKTDSIPAEVTALVEERAAAKKAKDWGRADAIRAQLTEMGWSVTDTAQGPKLAKL